MANDKTNYLAEAESDAWDMAEKFVEEMIDQWCESGEISDDILNDYSGGDRYHHDTHVDKSYGLSEAAELLDQLGEYEETDEGLWDGLKPRDAISAQAAYTYGNAVYDEFSDVVEILNGYLDDLFGDVDWFVAETERRKDWAAANPADDGEDADEFGGVARGYDGPDADDLKHTAVKSWLELYLYLRTRYADNPLYDGAMRSLEAGDHTGVLALCDWLDEHGESSVTLRAMAK